EAAQVTLNAYGDINVVINPPSAQRTRSRRQPQAPSEAVAPAPEKPKRWKLFSGIAKLFSGLVLLSANPLAIPTVIIGSVAAIPIVISLATGITAVTGGISELLREGE